MIFEVAPCLHPPRIMNESGNSGWQDRYQNRFSNLPWKLICQSYPSSAARGVLVPDTRGNLELFFESSQKSFASYNSNNLMVEKLCFNCQSFATNVKIRHRVEWLSRFFFYCHAWSLARRIPTSRLYIIIGQPQLSFWSTGHWPLVYVFLISIIFFMILPSSLGLYLEKHTLWPQFHPKLLKSLLLVTLEVLVLRPWEIVKKTNYVSVVHLQLLHFFCEAIRFKGSSILFYVNKTILYLFLSTTRGKKETSLISILEEVICVKKTQ